LIERRHATTNEEIGPHSGGVVSFHLPAGAHKGRTFRGGRTGAPSLPLHEAGARVVWCKREFERFEEAADRSDPRTDRTRRKLQQDLAKAETDLEQAENAKRRS